MHPYIVSELAKIRTETLRGSDAGPPRRPRRKPRRIRWRRK
jgi:hypothetical protein